MASSKTVLSPFCVRAEHSKYLTACISFCICSPCGCVKNKEISIIEGGEPNQWPVSSQPLNARTVARWSFVYDGAPFWIDFGSVPLIVVIWITKLPYRVNIENCRKFCDIYAGQKKRAARTGCVRLTRRSRHSVLTDELLESESGCSLMSVHILAFTLLKKTRLTATSNFGKSASLHFQKLKWLLRSSPATKFPKHNL